MKKNRITLTEDILKVVSTIKVFPVEIPNEFNNGKYIAAIDNKSTYGGSDVLEDISYALSCYDEHEEGSENNSNGLVFSEDLENKMYDIHEFIIEHLVEIETLMHYWSNKGGLKPGTYNTITMEKEN